MVGLHSAVGVVVIAVNAVAAVIGIVYYRRNVEPSRGYLHLLALAQTTLVAQAAVGLLLLSGGHRAGEKLHYLYGAVGLAAVLSPWLYAPSEPRRRLLWFTGATLLAAALGVRGYMSGS